MAKTLTCRDCGIDCDFGASAGSVEEIMSISAQHAAEAHGIKELPSEMLESMRGAIKDL